MLGPQRPMVNCRPTPYRRGAPNVVPCRHAPTCGERTTGATPPAIGREDEMSRARLLRSTRLSLTLLAILLLLCAMAGSGTVRAQNETDNVPCGTGLKLPAELAELDLASLQATLQALVTEDPDATVTLLFDGEEVLIVSADLLLADDAVLTALLEGQAVDVTVQFPEGEEELAVVVGIEVSTAEDCTVVLCVPGIELPASLADLDVAGLRAELEKMVAQNADATVTVPIRGRTIIRADLLLDLEDPVLEALLAGEPLSVSLDIRDDAFEIIGITLPEEGNQCEGPTGPPQPEPKPGDIQDDEQTGEDTQDDKTGTGDTQGDRQGGAKPTAPDNQQTGTGNAQDDKQGTGNVQDNQQTGAAAPETGSGTVAVTKTFQLTLYGDVPDGTAFSVEVENETTGSAEGVWLCGSAGANECQGSAEGSVYTATRQYPEGTVLTFTWTRWIPGDPEGNPFGTGRETIITSMTNSAWFRFEPAKDTKDDQQDTGAGDVQDDQQVEVPKAMPSTGAGGMAGGGIPLGTVAATIMMLAAGGYATLRRR